MRKEVTSILIIAFAAATVNAEANFLRLLDDAKNGTRAGVPKKYDEDLKIPFKASLGCGACIRGGYIFCLPGAEGSDSTAWKAGLTPVCCENSTNCA